MKMKDELSIYFCDDLIGQGKHRWMDLHLEEVVRKWECRE